MAKRVSVATSKSNFFKFSVVRVRIQPGSYTLAALAWGLADLLAFDQWIVQLGQSGQVEEPTSVAAGDLAGGSSAEVTDAINTRYLPRAELPRRRSGDPLPGLIREGIREANLQLSRMMSRPNTISPPPVTTSGLDIVSPDVSTAAAGALTPPPLQQGVSSESLLAVFLVCLLMGGRYNGWFVQNTNPDRRLGQLSEFKNLMFFKLSASCGYMNLAVVRSGADSDTLTVKPWPLEGRAYLRFGDVSPAGRLAVRGSDGTVFKLVFAGGMLDSNGEAVDASDPPRPALVPFDDARDSITFICCGRGSLTIKGDPLGFSRADGYNDVSLGYTSVGGSLIFGTDFVTVDGAFRTGDDANRDVVLLRDLSGMQSSEAGARACNAVKYPGDALP